MMLEQTHTSEAVCPYWGRIKGARMYCELATFNFPDAESKRQIFAFCGDMRGYKECPLYKTLTEYYERKYEERNGNGKN